VKLIGIDGGRHILVKIEKGKEYMAGPYKAWRCVTLARKSAKGTVLVEWKTGFLKDKKARILVKDMGPCE
jgi:hypothetical protein